VAKRKPKSKPATSGARDDSRPASVIFYNADLGMVSPAVSDCWPRPVQELLRESDAIYSTNFPGASCARFIGWYLAQPGAGFCLGVHNLPASIRNYDGDQAGPGPDWHDRLLAEVGAWDPNAVLVRLDGLTVTQGGRLLWRSDWVQRAAGQKFSPVGRRQRAWIAQQLEAARRFVAVASPAYAGGPVTLEALDRAWAAWLPRLEADAGAAAAGLDPEAVVAALRPTADTMHATLEAFGVQFGQFLVDGAGFEWAVAIDSRLGSELVVRALPGRGDVLVYPVKFVEKRWYGRESGFLASSFEAIREDVAAFAASRQAAHWPW
jgi:uncharacterized protein (DUF934 family)